MNFKKWVKVYKIQTAGYNGARTVFIFKLADRMRSMRTNGASKNRDSWSPPPHLSFFRILKLLCYFGTYCVYIQFFWRLFLRIYFQIFYKNFTIFYEYFYDVFFTILKYNFFKDFFDKFWFFRFFRRFFLTFNLLTIASFRIRVPSILFLDIFVEFPFNISFSFFLTTRNGLGT